MRISHDRDDGHEMALQLRKRSLYGGLGERGTQESNLALRFSEMQRSGHRGTTSAARRRLAIGRPLAWT